MSNSLVLVLQGPTLVSVEVPHKFYGVNFQQFFIWWLQRCSPHLLFHATVCLVTLDLAQWRCRKATYCPSADQVSIFPTVQTHRAREENSDRRWVSATLSVNACLSLMWLCDKLATCPAAPRHPECRKRGHRKWKAECMQWVNVIFLGNFIIESDFETSRAHFGLQRSFSRPPSLSSACLWATVACAPKLDGYLLHCLRQGLFW